jgi:hypothetical protein
MQVGVISVFVNIRINHDILSDLLKDEKTGVDLVSPTLPALKTMLENPPSKDQPEALAGYAGLVHGLFSSCLVNIDEMRCAENPPVMFWCFY